MQANPGFSVVFDLQLAHGLCSGVHIPPWQGALPDEALGRLSGEEQRYATALAQGRQSTWVAGRIAMRRALQRLGVKADSTLPDDRGAPILPSTVVGSISHKRTLAVAMVSEAAGWTLGVDLEDHSAPVKGIARRVLTPREKDEIDRLSEAGRSRAVLLRFSLKEAIYKAIDPFVKRYVGFREVSVWPADNGSAAVAIHFVSDPALAVETCWMEYGDYFLTSARARAIDRAETR